MIWAWHASPVLQIDVDDLSSSQTQALIAHHLAGMHATSPPESVHALDVERLRDHAITFYAARDGDALAGIGALKDLGGGEGELKSMRVADAYLGRGVGRALLHHLLAEAGARGWRRLLLETGTQEEFRPARTLYAAAGFAECPPFADYRPDPNSVFLARTL